MLQVKLCIFGIHYSTYVISRNLPTYDYIHGLSMRSNDIITNYIIVLVYKDVDNLKAHLFLCFLRSIAALFNPSLLLILYIIITVLFLRSYTCSIDYNPHNNNCHKI